MLKMRLDIYRLSPGQTDGMSTQSWNEVETGVPCFVDLQYIRMGKDPMWTPEAGRPSERTGVAFMKPSVPVHSGDRFFVTRGPAGWFSLEGADDFVWTPREFHHRELGIKEVGSPLAPNAANTAIAEPLTGSAVAALSGRLVLGGG